MNTSDHCLSVWFSYLQPQRVVVKADTIHKIQILSEMPSNRALWQRNIEGLDSNNNTVEIRQIDVINGCFQAKKEL